ncbi:hypothetical protein F5Y11DRAFT_346852 [Daldinia sp. FL1419]|nr:hypothetical protein F5Y11DRAFT_346852 [Daldinia sp. FL1419]
MASNDQNMPSWIAKQAEIDRFLDQVDNRRRSAAFIQGPHASGKSTTMMAHILTKVRSQVPGAPVICWNICPSIL